MSCIHNGRPQDSDGRLIKEIKTYDLLDSLGISYVCVDHAPAMTMDVCNEISRVLNTVICKNLLLCNRQCTQFYLLMIPGDKRFLTRDLSSQLGVARLSFAPPSYMEELVNITPGSLSVIGLMNDSENRVTLLIDRDLLNLSDIGIHPCINTSSIRLKTDDLIKKIIPALHHEPVYVNLPAHSTDEQ